MSTALETYVYKSTPECDIHADVYRTRSGDTPSPVVIWIHGGALISGTRTWFPEDKRDLYLHAGYTVVSIDYRLAPETKLPFIIEDVRDAFTWVREQGPKLFNIDPHRLGVVGHSAGGYLTLMSGNFSPRPCALVSFYGYGDLIGAWYSKPDPFYCSMPAISKEDAYQNVEGPETTGARDSGSFYLYCRQQGIWPNEVGGIDPHANPTFFTPYCPEQNVIPDYPPTLLLHGTADTDVPYNLSVRMAEVLAQDNVEHELIAIPDGPHVFDQDMSKPEVRDAMQMVLAFLNRHLGITVG